MKMNEVHEPVYFDPLLGKRCPVCAMSDNKYKAAEIVELVGIYLHQGEYVCPTCAVILVRAVAINGEDWLWCCKSPLKDECA